MDEQESLEYSNNVIVRFCKSLGLTQFNTSAMSGEGINRLFSHAVKTLFGSIPEGLNEHTQAQNPIMNEQNRNHNQKVKLDGEKPAKKKKKDCC